MAVTGDRRRRTLFDEDQECYRTSSGNRERHFGRGCVQTSAAVDGGRSIPPTPLFSGPSDGEREYQRWNAHRRICSPPPSHRYLRHHSPPSPSSSSSRHHKKTPQIHHNQKSHHRDQHLDSIFDSPQKLHKFANTHKNQIGITKINSGFSPKTHRPSQFRDLHHSFNPTCETQSTKTYLQPQNLASTHDTRKKSQISQRRDLLATCPVNQPESDRVSIVDSPHKPNGIFIPQMGTRPNSNSKPEPSLPRNRPTTLVDMMQFVSDWFDFEEILVDESAESERINRSESELSKNEIDDDESMAVETQEISAESSTIDVYHPNTTIHVYHYDSALHVFNSMPRWSSVSYNAMMSGYLRNDDFDLAREVFDKMPERDLVSWNVMISGYLRNKNLSEARELFEAMTCRNVGSWNTMITGYAQSGELTLVRNLFDRSPLDTIACDSVRFAEPMNDKIVLSVLIGQIVSTLGFGFENVKTKRVRRRQWQIAWASLACHWTIVLVPLWLWVALRRDFSIGVYHSHKPNRGHRSIVVLLVLLPRASTELEVEFFSKKG